MNHSRRRVAVTGLGIASAIGLDEASVWRRLLAGEGGIAPLTQLDTSDFLVGIGGEADSAGVRERLKELKRRPSDRALDLAVVAADDALREAGLIDGDPPYEAQEVGVVLGTGVGSAQSHFDGFSAFFDRGVRGLRPTTIPRCMYNAISSGLSIQYRLTGPNYMVVSACTSATNAIGVAFRSIRDGYADVVLTGGSDGFFDPFFYGVWNNLGVLSSIEDPAQAIRPFDADRQGTILGEGAGMLVLEAHDRATARGAQIRGEIVGYGETSDAAHRTQPSPDGQALAMEQALADAALAPSELGLISAHGTATQANDSCESESIRRVLGGAAAQVPVIASKSYFGHTLGASGALETIVALLALEAGTAPPNLNLDRPDPECGDLCLVRDEPRSLTSPFAMKNSFGFGGGNGVLVLRAATSS